MKFAVIARPPVVGGKVVSFDASAALKVPGVEKVVKIDANACAREVQSARRRGGDREQYLGGDQRAARPENRVGRRAEQVLRLGRLQGACWKSRSQEPGKVERNDGDADKALELGGAKVITARVLRAASRTRHDGAAGRDGAPLTDGKLEVWAPVQSPGGAREDIAKALGMKPRRRDGATARCSAAASAASRNATLRSRRPCCRKEVGGAAQ